MSLIDCLTTTEPLAAIFSDASVLQAMLDVEAALARAAARAGAIPDRAAAIISAAARAEEFDAAAIAREARAPATPAIPLVKALTERVRAVDAPSADYVHWGATSQDVTDTAMILLLKRARPVLAADWTRLDAALRDVSDRHARTVMLGRTLLRAALPITFGLKAAGWCAAAGRSWRRLSAAWDAALVLQFGGAVGTRAAFGDRAAAIEAALVNELDLAAAPSWQTDRDRLGALATAAALHTAALAKMARDLMLLMQDEVGEAAEPGGSSSAMPHKRNPAACTLAVAAATRTSALAGAFLHGMMQEHERAAGGSQAEWPTIAAIVQATGSALAAMAPAVEGLEVNPERMRANLDATGGSIFAERAIAILVPHLGRRTAERIVADALRMCREQGERFGSVLRAMPQVAGTLPAGALEGLDRPEEYLGEAERLRRLLLEY